jgi:membrane fusion protein, multidrug efflux system
VQRSYIIAIGIFLALVAFFAISTVVRLVVGAGRNDASAVAEAAEVPQAVVQRASAVMHAVTVKAKGRTAPDKMVTVSSGTTGTVVSTPAREGSFVRRGTLLCGLDVEARNARVKEAEALRENARIDFEAARTLAAKGLAPANQETAARARLDATEAAVNAAKVELGKTQIRAPFDGVFETRLAETGDFLGPGAPCGVLVDLSPVVLTAEVSEADASKIKVGTLGRVTLADGRTYPGKVRYTARMANAATRTFLIEAELQSDSDTISAGASAEFAVAVGEVPATLITPALLTLSDDGDVGVRYVEANNTVQFAQVTVIEEVAGGAWVTGLPETANIVAMGQDYLAEGITVKPVTQTGAQTGVTP